MRVLLIAPSPPPAGGIQSVTENLVKFVHHNKNGTNLILYNTTHHIRPITSESLFVRLYTGIINSLKTYYKVNKLMKKNQPEIIHLASSSSLALIKDYLILKLANRIQIPAVMHWHFGRIPSLQKKNNWEWRLLQNVIRKSSLSIVIDQKSYDTLIEEGISNIEYIPNPLAIDLETKAQKLLEKPIPKKQGRLIYVGHIIKDKGVFELVEACWQNADIKELILIGPCEETIKKALRKIAQKRKDEKWLKFTNELNIERVIEHMAQAPVLVLPSYTEGFPMVILEAMAMGCAIVASNVGAIPEMLAIHTNSPCGICVRPRNIEKLKEAIINLTGNQHKIETLGKRASNRVLKSYTIDKVYQKYCGVWEKAINQTTSHK